MSSLETEAAEPLSPKVVTPPAYVISDRTLEAARFRLSRFIEQQAEETAERLGFGWVRQEDAPDEYDSLVAAFEWSTASKQSLPVSDAHCESVIYDCASVNLALRFWHDVAHVELGLTFEVLDELELALYQLRCLELEGFRRVGLVWQLLHADLVGQAYLSGLAAGFPGDQRQFVERCLRLGFDEAVLREGPGLRAVSA